MSVPEVAQALGVSPGTVCRWSDMAYLESYRTPRGQRCFSRTHVDRLISLLEHSHGDPLVDRQTG